MNLWDRYERTSQSLFAGNVGQVGFLPTNFSLTNSGVKVGRLPFGGSTQPVADLPETDPNAQYGWGGPTPSESMFGYRPLQIPSPKFRGRGF